MTKLTQDQLTHFGQLLRDRDTALRADIQREKAGADDYQQAAGEAPDSGDASTATLYSDLGHAEVARDIEELRQVEAAQQRLRDGSYGICIDCGRAIPRERLEVQPMAIRCTRDQEQYEKTYAAGARPTSL